MKKIMLISIIAGLGISACNPKKETSTKLKNFPVTSPVVLDTLYTNEYVADIHALQHVEIHAKVKGYIEKVHIDEGQAVKKGQLLFSLSSQEYLEEVLKAKALLKSAVAEAKSAELDLKNSQILVEKNVVSQTQADLAQAKLDAFRAKIDEAEANMSNAILSLSFTEIKAPFDGILNRIPNKTGSLVDEGTLLTTISDSKEVFAYFKVSEKEYLDFAADTKSTEKNGELTLILANNQVYPYPGKIETIEGEIDKATGNIAFRARFQNPNHLLKHGSSGKISLKKEARNALIIPQKATFEIQDKLYVYVMETDSTVRMRNIVTGLRLPHLYAVTSGLCASDKIIYEGIQNLNDGMKINPQPVAMKQIITQLAVQ
ncbi:MAG: efflux RND transporter periplasmic adaptor subunit [Verrucomicrobia bacterium]|nr:efflux RND transporter periplasmic adaptor subunit [Cytophagales bacterium]